jgi:hypothetical protein
VIFALGGNSQNPKEILKKKERIKNSSDVIVVSIPIVSKVRAWSLNDLSSSSWRAGGLPVRAAPV